MAITYTPLEERLHSSSHALGIALGVGAGMAFGWQLRNSADILAWCSIFLYMAGMLGCYISSTAYHACSAQSPWKEPLRRADHAAIYWHIAGSYSPLCLIPLRSEPAWAYSLLAFQWIAALAGTAVSLRKLKEHSSLETLCFVGMGLSALVAFQPLMRTVSTAALWLIMAEGVSYITGALFYSLRRPYMHVVFHLFVLGGSVCHVLAVWDVLNRMA